MASSALRGKREQRHYGFHADETASGVRRGDGDLRQLYRTGIDNDRTISKSQQAIVAEFPVRHRHDVGARYQVSAVRGAHRMQRCADRIRSGMGHATHAAVGITPSHHERREVQGFGGQLFGFDLRHAPRTPALVQQACVLSQIARCRWIDELHAGHRGFGTDQNRLGNSFAHQPFRSRLHA